ncbi:F-box domain-containing protein [Phlyctema vagabunda]|uniref:F-box domain-containing protein n=1 Tax=Phlyctema vagabunda TaxID=108571 RepID=A0ABR4PYS8_9HELO
MDTALIIPELLEAVLLHLDMTTLLVSASRVSKTWHNVITSSHAIQQALYFRPISTKTSRTSMHGPEDFQIPGWNSLHDEEDEPAPVLNPLLMKKFEGCFFDFGGEYGYLRRANAFYSLPWTTRTRRVSRTRTDTQDCTSKCIETDTQTAQDEETAQRRRFTRSGASWRRMLVSQPPPPQLGYLMMELSNDWIEAQTVSKALVTPNPQAPFDGLRMGELYDIVQYHAGHHERYSLWFRIIWGQPREPFVTSLNRETCQSLLSQTNVVVELYHFADEGYTTHPYDPADLGVFEAAFRSDQYRPLNFTASKITADQYEYPGWTYSATVW